MTSEAICLILDKAWENNSRALLFIKDGGKFEIIPELWDWEMYDSIDTLCIFDKNSKIEYYFDINYISEISIQTDDNRGDKEKGIGTERGT
jgi:hypothetical protein